MGFLRHQNDSCTHNHITLSQDYFIEFQVCWYEPFMTFENLRVLLPEMTFLFFFFSSPILIKGAWEPEEVWFAFFVSGQKFHFCLTLLQLLLVLSSCPTFPLYCFVKQTFRFRAQSSVIHSAGMLCVRVCSVVSDSSSPEDCSQPGSSVHGIVSRDK